MTRKPVPRECSAGVGVRASALARCCPNSAPQPPPRLCPPRAPRQTRRQVHVSARRAPIPAAVPVPKATAPRPPQPPSPPAPVPNLRIFSPSLGAHPRNSCASCHVGARGRRRACQTRAAMGRSSTRVSRSVLREIPHQGHLQRAHEAHAAVCSPFRSVGRLRQHLRRGRRAACSFVVAFPPPDSASRFRSCSTRWTGSERCMNEHVRGGASAPMMPSSASSWTPQGSSHRQRQLLGPPSRPQGPGSLHSSSPSSFVP